jgi:hypothetical protein
LNVAAGRGNFILSKLARGCTNGFAIAIGSVSTFGKALLHWFAKTALARQTTEGILRAQCRRHLADLDRKDAARCQTNLLLGIVHKAQSTRFGREHDLNRVRTPDDFRRLVPVRTAAELAGAIWPDRSPFSPFPARQAAIRTALAFVLHAQPQSRLLSGRLVFLGEDEEALPSLVRPYAVEERADLTAPVTCLAGPADQLLELFEILKGITGKESVAEVWPGLTAVLYDQQLGESMTARLRAEVGSRARLLETAFLSEGIVAVEDPRFGCPRLLTDHGVYFEFVPVSQAGKSQPERFSIGGVEPGVPYDLVLTSPAGLWACRVGRTVVFERRDLPLVRFLEAPSPAPPSVRADAPTVTVPEPPLHRQNGGIPAAPPEKFGHTLWSIPLGRG